MGTNLTNQKYGKLIALEPTEKRQYGSIVWKCSCECGNKNVLVPARRLTQGYTKSCGCLNIERQQQQRKNLVGQEFGQLTVIKDLGTKSYSGKKRGFWLC